MLLLLLQLLLLPYSCSRLVPWNSIEPGSTVVVVVAPVALHILRLRFCVGNTISFSASCRSSSVPHPPLAIAQHGQWKHRCRAESDPKVDYRAKDDKYGRRWFCGTGGTGAETPQAKSRSHPTLYA